MKSTRKDKSAFALAALFTTSGIAHFLWPRPFENIVPPAIGHERFLVAASGAAELIIAAALMRSSTRRSAGLAAVVLLVLVFPANVYMAVERDTTNVTPWISWARLPLQLPLIWIAWRIWLRDSQAPHKGT
jgi:uncharacterized membrane protein